MVRAITVLFGLVFGGVFAGTGLYIALQTAVPMFLDYQTAKKWQPVSALLLSVSGDESSTSAKYEYQYNGRVYQGDRVHIARFNDNIGSYHADMQRRLNRSLETRNPVAIYVNPEMPGDAVLDRSMRWGMFSLATAFCSVFVLVGLLVMWSSFFVKPKSRKNPLPDLLKLRQEWKETSEARESFLSFLERRKRQLSLKEGNDAAREVEKDRAHKRLWQQKKGWETHRIRSDAKTGVVAMWFFALVWNSISFGLLFAMLKEWRHQDYMALLVLLFPLVGLLLFYQAVRKSFEYRRFGIVEYEMDPYPGAIGGNVGGAITINRLKRATTDFIVGLECVYSYVSGSGKNRSRSERIEWAEEGSAKAVRVVDGTRIDFSFSVPANLPESDIEQSGNYYFWRLKVRAVLKGVDLNRSYNIPVLATGELSQGRYRDISSLAKKEKQRQSEISKSAITSGRFNETVLAKSMRIKREGREVLLVFPMFRNKILSLFALIFGGGFGFATYSVITGFSGSGLFSIFAYIFIIPFAVIAFLGTIIGIYMPLNNLRVRLANRQVTVLRRLFLLPIYYKKVEKREITSLTTKRTGSTGQGVKKVEHFKILAHLKNGGSMTIAEGVDGEDLAEQFRDYLMQKIQAC